MNWKSAFSCWLPAKPVSPGCISSASSETFSIEGALNLAVSEGSRDHLRVQSFARSTHKAQCAVTLTATVFTMKGFRANRQREKAHEPKLRETRQMLRMPFKKLFKYFKYIDSTGNNVTNIHVITRHIWQMLIYCHFDFNCFKATDIFEAYFPYYLLVQLLFPQSWIIM